MVFFEIKVESEALVVTVLPSLREVKATPVKARRAMTK
jgi:hypothetical protein